jgi:hypothetical protein
VEVYRHGTEWKFRAVGQGYASGLVPAADGHIDPAEHHRVASLIATNEVLGDFPADDPQRRFDAHLAKLPADFAFGKVSVLHEIGKVRKQSGPLVVWLMSVAITTLISHTTRVCCDGGENRRLYGDLPRIFAISF